MRSRSLPDPADAWTPDDARRLFEELRRSGGTLAEFARRHGIAPSRLYWWKKRLANDSPSLKTLSFVPATVVAAETAGAIAVVRLPNGIEIEIANGSPNLIAAIVTELTRSTP